MKAKRKNGSRERVKSVPIGDIVSLFIGAAIFFILGWNFNLPIEGLLQNGVKAQGTVVNAYSASKYQTNYVVHYTIVSGQEITSELISSPPVRVGDTVELLYNPNNPREVMLDSVRPSSLMYWAAAFFALVGVFGIYLRKKGIAF